MAMVTLRKAIEQDKEAIKEILGMGEQEVKYAKITGGTTKVISEDELRKELGISISESKYTKEEWIERTKKKSEANQKHLMLSEAGVKIGSVINLAGDTYTLVGIEFNEETFEYEYKVLRKWEAEERVIPFNYFIAAGVFNKDDVAVDEKTDQEVEAGKDASTTEA